jgi:hypothetical protein
MVCIFSINHSVSRGTYSLSYSPDQEVGASKHHFPAVDLQRRDENRSEDERACVYLFLQKDKPYLQRTGQSLVKDRVALRNSRKHNKQKMTIPSLLNATAMP